MRGPLENHSQSFYPFRDISNIAAATFWKQTSLSVFISLQIGISDSPKLKHMIRVLRYLEIKSHFHLYTSIPILLLWIHPTFNFTPSYFIEASTIPCCAYTKFCSRVVRVLRRCGVAWDTKGGRTGPENLTPSLSLRWFPTPTLLYNCFHLPLLLLAFIPLSPTPN